MFRRSFERNSSFFSFDYLCSTLIAIKLLIMIFADAITVSWIFIQQNNYYSLSTRGFLTIRPLRSAVEPLIKSSASFLVSSLSLSSVESSSVSAKYRGSLIGFYSSPSSSTLSSSSVSIRKRKTDRLRLQCRSWL